MLSGRGLNVGDIKKDSSDLKLRKPFEKLATIKEIVKQQTYIDLRDFD